MLLDQEDFHLIDVAKSTIERLYIDGKHHIGAAVRTKSGKIYSAVHLEAYIGRVSVCAEAIVLGKAISEGESDFDTIVAVRHPDPSQDHQEIEVVSPCGICRELISDYGKDTYVILKREDKYIKMKINELLPEKYTR
ncbi:cytidine deaminase [Paenibacillus sp. BR2-3]|uniref:cytidine deaminase n=1 Tax=Paenibacillus sp. BR2-3 TaxID=3048494 RepID=UPI003977BE84